MGNDTLTYDTTYEQTLLILMENAESFKIIFSLSITGYLKSYFKLESFSNCSQLFQLSKEES